MTFAKNRCFNPGVVSPPHTSRQTWLVPGPQVVAMQLCGKCRVAAVHRTFEGLGMLNYSTMRIQYFITGGTGPRMIELIPIIVRQQQLRLPRIVCIYNRKRVMVGGAHTLCAIGCLRVAYGLIILHVRH
jgi:hypothetical protein